MIKSEWLKNTPYQMKVSIVLFYFLAVDHFQVIPENTPAIQGETPPLPQNRYFREILLKMIASSIAKITSLPIFVMLNKSSLFANFTGIMLSAKRKN